MDCCSNYFPWADVTIRPAQRMRLKHADLAALGRSVLSRSAHHLAVAGVVTACLGHRARQRFIAALPRLRRDRRGKPLGRRKVPDLEQRLQGHMELPPCPAEAVLARCQACNVSMHWCASFYAVALVASWQVGLLRSKASKRPLPILPSVRSARVANAAQGP